MTDLPDWLDETGAPPDWSDDLLPGDSDETEQRTGPFRIDSDALASWALRRLRGLRSQIDEIEQIAGAEIERVEAWRARSSRPLERNAAFFEAILSDYALRCRAESGRKTISLPAGKISTRQPAARWIVDSDTFIPWARQSAPDLLRIKEEPNLAEMKAAAGVLALIVSEETGTVVTPDGEILPGVEVSEQQPTASISIDAD